MLRIQLNIAKDEKIFKIYYIENQKLFLITIAKSTKKKIGEERKQ